MKHYCYNITNEVLDYAYAKGLEAIGTGGGCDYVYKRFFGDDRTDDNNEKFLAAIITIPEGGESPDTLQEAASVVMFLDREWYKSIEIKFDTCKRAIDFLSSITSYDCE